MDPLKELGELIEAARKVSEYPKQNDFAKKIGVSGAHLSRCENGIGTPSPKMIRKIGDLVPGAPAQKMLGLLLQVKGWEEEELGLSSAEPRPKERKADTKGKLRVIGQAKAGPWMEAVENWDDLPGVESWEAVDDAELRVTKGKRAFWVRVSGDSMNREGITEGGLILIALEPYKKGDPALVRLGNEVTIKFVEIEDGDVCLVPSSTNPAHRRQRISMNEWESKGGVACRIVGYKAPFRRF